MKEDVDARDKRGHDAEFAANTVNDRHVTSE
jgi:hypothetical protein